MDIIPKLIRPTPPGSTRLTRSSKAAGVEKFNSQSESTSGAQSHQASSAFGIRALDGLFLNLQERGRSQQQAIDYGNTLLDELEKLRLMLLDGSISAPQLQRLNQILKQKPDFALPEELQELLQEIEIRTAVEIAKLERDL